MTSSVTRRFLLAVVLASFLAVDVSAQKRQGTRIIDVETDRLSSDLIVKVSGAGTAWVGLTIYPGREINLDPVRIWPMRASGAERIPDGGPPRRVGRKISVIQAS